MRVRSVVLHRHATISSGEALGGVESAMPRLTRLASSLALWLAAMAGQAALAADEVPGLDDFVGGSDPKTANVSQTITLPAGQNAKNYWTDWMNQPDTSTSISLSIVKSGSGDIAFSGYPSFLGASGPVGYRAIGMMDKKHHAPEAAGAPGPRLDAVIHAASAVHLSRQSIPVPAPGAYTLVSLGAEALSFFNDRRSSSGGAGGDVTVTVDTGDTFSLTGTPDTYTADSPWAAVSLPWQSASSILHIESLGGAGAIVQDNCGESTCWDGYGQGGDGGAVSVKVAGGQRFLLGTADNALTTQANAPAVAVLAVSRGVGSSIQNANSRDAGANGKGGAVDLTFGGTIRADASTAGHVVGLVAASVGGATESGKIQHVAPTASGPGGSVDVHLQGADIELTTRNAIGVMATSTSDWLDSVASAVSGGGASFGPVTVAIDSASSISVGNDQQAAATDTIIGVLASSAVTWSAQPFLGTPVSTLVSPGNAGSVMVQQAGSVSAHGSNAIGILAQSIAGDGAGVSGGAHAFVGSKGGNGGTAGSVAYQGDGGRVLAAGDGAAGVLLQSIAGGGGNGGNAAGFFVAVGGDGGAGGTAGTVSFSQRNRASVTTTGDHAKGVVLQSIGGGGGNGGYAKSYTAGVPASVGVGGKGGIGGDGGRIELGGQGNGASDNTATIVTSGQHAVGIMAQTLGGGGGTGGAATSFNVSDGLNVSVAVGGSGGAGGNGGDITGANGVARASSLGTVTTTGHDAHGLLLQSIGGGGGAGGGSTAAALSLLGLPEMPNINVGVSVGGSGGTAGKGGSIELDLVNAVSTRGAGAHGVVLQSIGGGGGAGGDSTAAAGSLLSTSSFAFNGAVSVGGSGGAGGQGGSVDLSLSGTQATEGHQAVGILAQSIGGGGGTAGVGNAATVTALALKERNAQLAIGVGGAGGSGGTGGSVTIRSSGSSSIRVGGSGSSGVVAQSIGGGGGLAGNAGTQGIGGQYNGKVAVGGSGGSGHHGGAVSLDYAGHIETGAKVQAQYTTDTGGTLLSTPLAIGGSSHGILAQSIGGGGGVGGNADPTAGILPDLAEAYLEVGNKMLDAKGAIMWFSRKVAHYPSKEFEWPRSYTSSVAVGGSGGAAGDGGAVAVKVDGGSSILTHGHRSYAVLAQSIGGGGGEGGQTSSDALIDADAELSPVTGGEFSLGVNVGGGGGGGGKGGDIQLLVNNPFQSAQGNLFRTTGYASHVLLAQSIGGGGGVGHEGSILGLAGSLIGLDTPEGKLGSHDAANPSAGNGGAVSVGTTASPLVGHFLSAGDDAGVVLAQSIGGGGGLLSFGCTNSGRGQAGLSASACHMNAETADGVLAVDDYVAEAFVNGIQANALSVAPSNTASAGGKVAIVTGQGTVMASVGNRSPVLVAQSVGSGGGYATAHRTNVASAGIQGNAAKATGSGGDIQVNLGGTTLSTAGDGAWGVLAQSVAAGGGVLGDLAADLLAVPAAAMSIDSATPATTGGDIVLTLDNGTRIQAGQASGGGAVVNAHAIVAQSLGSGGGIFGGDQQKASASLDLAVGNQAHGQGGRIQVSTASGTVVETDAIGGIGILAQSAGTAVSHQKDSSVQISIDGMVTGGRSGVNPTSGAILSGVGVMISGGAIAGLDVTNTVVVGEGAQLSTQGGTQQGYAVRSDHGVTNVINHGTIIGNVDLGATPGSFVNAAAGELQAGAVLNLNGQTLHNHGTLHVAGAETLGTTRLTGDLEQHREGRLVVTVDALAPQTRQDSLYVSGQARLAGTVAVRASSLLPGTFTVLEAGDLQFNGAVAASPWMRWATASAGNRLALTPVAAFDQAAAEYGGTAASLGRYLQRGWNGADAGKARLFGYLSQLGSSTQYRETLQQLGGQQFHAMPQQVLLDTPQRLDDATACPAAGTPGAWREAAGCTWVRLSTARADQSATDQNLGHDARRTALRAGTQRELGAGWRVGGALGAQVNRLSADGYSSRGNVFDASLALSRDLGGWTFSGAVAVAHGRFDNQRTPQLGRFGQASGLDHSYDSRSRLTLVSGRVQASYTFGTDDGYVRPAVAVDVTASRSPGFSESGGPLALEVGPVSQVTVAVTPMVEAGKRFPLGAQSTARVYARAGVSLLPNNQRSSDNRLAGAASQIGSFESRSEGPPAVARLNLGVQVFKKNGVEIGAEAHLESGRGYRSHGVSARLNYRF